MTRVPLIEIALTINSGLTPLRSNPEFWQDGEIPWVKTEQLGEKNIYDSNEKITKFALASTSIKLNPPNTLSIAMYGEGKTRGSVSILKIETTTNQACCNIVIDKDKADFEFLYYYLNTQYDNLRNLSSGVRKNLNSNDIKNFEVFLPNLLVQKQIAKVLSDIDAKIEVNNKINQELEAMAKTLYDYWFVQFDFPDTNGKPYKSSGGKMVFNEELKREIPERWEVDKLGNCINIFDSLRVPLSRGEREKIEGDFPYYGATSIMGYVNDYIFDDDYILLAEDGSVMNKKGFPIVQYIWGKTWVNNHAHVLQAKNKLHNEFIYQQVKMIPVVLVKTGSIQMKINQENLKKYKVQVPANELIQKYSIKANSIRKKLVNNIEENQKLSELRDWLLPMLMNGQVIVGEVYEKEENKLGMVAENESTYKKIKVISFKELYPDPYIRKQREAKKNKLKRRQVLTTTRIIHLHKERKQDLGHTKTEKINHAIEYITQLELGRDPVKNVGGPVDFYYVKAFVEPLAKKQKVFEAIETEDGYYYETKENFQTFYNVSYKDKDFTPYNSQIDGIISSFVNLSLRETELYMTVYAGWNNLLIRKEETTLKDIVKESIDLWKGKRDKFTDDDVENAIEWLTNKNYDPKGFGKEVF